MARVGGRVSLHARVADGIGNMVVGPVLLDIFARSVMALTKSRVGNVMDLVRLPALNVVGEGR